LSKKQKHTEQQSCPCGVEHNVPRESLEAEPLDPGNLALAKGLKEVFIVLKIVMIGVVVLLIARGVFEVKQNEEAMVLRFGKPSAKTLEPGWHWAWPEPIDEIIIIPGSQRQLNVDSFWYFQTEQEKLGSRAPRFDNTLRLDRDGYSLTASSGSAANIKKTSVTDYNLVHTTWSIRYNITSPMAFVQQLWDGNENGWQSVNTLLQSILEDSVIVTSAVYDVDDIILKSAMRFREEVERQMQNRIAALKVGLEVRLELTNRSIPRQVKAAFDKASSSRSNKEELIKQADGEVSQIKNQAGAEAKLIIGRAHAYSETVSKAAEADAKYLNVVLAKIQQAVEQKVPKTVPDYKTKRKQTFDELLAVTVDTLYQEALREVVENADEVFTLPRSNGKPTELRMILSRDTSLRAKKNKKEE